MMYAFPHASSPPRPLTSVFPPVCRAAAWVVILTFYWNGMFFLERVIRSHERHVVCQQLGISARELALKAKKKDQ